MLSTLGRCHQLDNTRSGATGGNALIRHIVRQGLGQKRDKAAGGLAKFIVAVVSSARAGLRQVVLSKGRADHGLAIRQGLAESEIDGPVQLASFVLSRLRQGCSFARRWREGCTEGLIRRRLSEGAVRRCSVSQSAGARPSARQGLCWFECDSKVLQGPASRARLYEDRVQARFAAASLVSS
ncbi:hypothetical protein L3X38_003151 [Prunus dulcis]|uniref:Uncharacterized protein n=1 Tax=Prunus dulcis TaxID=3755 RepID=A0AAD4ZLH9_PRUDU|nr:hypothetical protein L3X38_003151 [Prunus dulcis]